ncbi:restriction endonuclease type II-like protein [Pisolithus croceorrhizus]|nr:restriction endonuclease type II-like protein [Pisolithus croceorrhizus]
MATKTKPPVVQPGAGNNIIINPNQRLNPVLDHIRHVGKEFGDIVPDYHVGRTTCILFLSLKYHRLHPEYIHTRIAKLGGSYNLRILLIMCDVVEHQELIRELTKVCLINSLTIVVAWSNEEAGQYIATFKQFEHKPPDLIKERVDKDYDSIFRTALTSINKVNRTDVATLRTSLGTFADIAKASPDRLQNLPGFGQVKVKRIKEAFEKPFHTKTANTTLSLSNQVNVLPTSSIPDISGMAPTRLPSKEKNSEVFSETPQHTRSQAGDTGLNSSIPSSSIISEGPDFTREALPERERSRPASPVWDIELDLND